MHLRWGYRLVMLLAVIVACVGAVSLLRTDSNGATFFPLIGVIVIWLLGGFVLWLSRGGAGTD